MQDNHLAKAAFLLLVSVPLPCRHKDNFYASRTRTLSDNAMPWTLSHPFQHEAQMLPTAQRNHCFSRHYFTLLVVSMHDSIAKSIYCIEGLP